MQMVIANTLFVLAAHARRKYMDLLFLVILLLVKFGYLGRRGGRA